MHQNKLSIDTCMNFILSVLYCWFHLEQTLGVNLQNVLFELHYDQAKDQHRFLPKKKGQVYRQKFVRKEGNSDYKTI